MHPTRRTLLLGSTLGGLTVCLDRGRASVKSAGVPPHSTGPVPAPKRVLVAGATGSIGHFVIEQLLERAADSPDLAVRGLTRRPDWARERWPSAEWVQGDLRKPESLRPALEGVVAIVFAAGSKSWADPTNTPELIDFGGVAALAELGAAAGARRYVLISSAGVIHPWPDSSDHLRGVLRWKREGERAVLASGLVPTILRPLGLWDRPGGELGIALLQGDAVRSRVTIAREDLARVASESLFLPAAQGKVVELFNAAAFDREGWKRDFGLLAPEPLQGPGVSTEESGQLPPGSSEGGAFGKARRDEG